MVNGGFDNIEAAELQDDNSLTGSDLQAQVAMMADRLSRRIDRVISANNRVMFVLDRDTALRVRQLAQLEDLSLSQMCSRLVTESVAEE